jgi:hypothetical protein
MERFLFVFGYESPTEHRSNREHGSDFESSNAVWVRASSEEEALSKGRAFADEFVAKLYCEKKAPESSRWSEQDFAHWISKKPLEEFSGLALETFDEI